ncbi:hypothetical protein AAGC94_18650 [Clostridium sporogenes]|uniref:Phage protein n=1 Tax=Clostridium cochlearium TaxID=1494 RepID=A0A2X2VY54_CLOCO|nr:hypothetical protein [Clostridium cochlearium]MBE6161917.1 hypothetical protein [Bacillota bacterium]SQB33588.1 Uncharacterised protein [Clostridium cochlearium]
MKLNKDFFAFYMLSISGKFKYYENWKEDWSELLFNIVLNKNYPIPEDKEDVTSITAAEHEEFLKDL